MPDVLRLSTADAQLAEELELVRWAMAQGWCTHESFAAELGVSRSLVSMMLAGLREPRWGLLKALRQHLDPDQLTALAVEQARRWGVDPGPILRERARQEERPRVWAEIIAVAAAHAAEAPEPTCVAAPEPTRIAAPAPCVPLAPRRRAQRRSARPAAQLTLLDPYAEAA